MFLFLCCTCFRGIWTVWQRYEREHWNVGRKKEGVRSLQDGAINALRGDVVGTTHQGEAGDNGLIP